MPSVRAFCLNEPSDLFINFESLATGVRALECALSSFTSSFVYSLRLLVVTHLKRTLTSTETDVVVSQTCASEAMAAELSPPRRMGAHGRKCRGVFRTKEV